MDIYTGLIKLQPDVLKQLPIQFKGNRKKMIPVWL